MLSTCDILSLFIVYLHTIKCKVFSSVSFDRCTHMNNPSTKVQIRKFLVPLILLPHTPLTEATADFCHCCLVLPILEFHINGIIQHCLFLNFMSVESYSTYCYVSGFFLAQHNAFEISLNCLVYEQFISLCVLWYGCVTQWILGYFRFWNIVIHHSLFNYLPLEGCLCFQFMAITNKGAINFDVQVFV